MMITRAQMRTMDSDLMDRLARWIESFLDAHCDFSHPHDGTPALVGAERAGAVRDLVGTARGYGIHTQRGIVQFVVLGLGYSRIFHEDPRVKELLTQADRSPDDSIQSILDTVVAAEARRAR